MSDEGKLLDKAVFFQKAQPRIRTAEVEGLGTVRIRELTGTQVQTLEEIRKDPEKTKLYGFHLLVQMVIDENGDRVFSEQDIPRLLDLGTHMVNDLIGEVASRDAWSAEAQSELEKKSEDPPGDSSS